MNTLPRKAAKNTKNALEWTVFGISSFLVLTTLVFLIHQAILHDDRPAELSATVEKIETNSSTVVTVAVENTGSQTAAEVHIAITAAFSSGVKVSTATLDFVPKKGRSHAFAVFDSLEKPSAVSSRVLGYTEP